MSTSNDQNDGSSIESNDDVTEITGVGDGISDELAESDENIETVQDLACTAIEDVQEACEDNSGIDDDQLSDAVRTARRGLGYDVHTIPDGSNNAGSSEDGEPDAPGASVVSGDANELDELVADIDDEPDEEFTVAAVAGNDSFAKAKNQAVRNGRASAFSAPAVVYKRMSEAGLLDDSGKPEFDKLVFPKGDVGSSSGNEWVLMWLQHTASEVDSVDAPDFEMVGIEGDESDRAEWSSRQWALAYEKRREAVLESANALLVVQNGDGVGRWVTDASELGLEIDAPEYNPGSDESDSDNSDANESADDSDADESDSDDNDDEESETVVARAVQQPDGDSGPDWTDAQEAEEAEEEADDE